MSYFLELLFAYNVTALTVGEVRKIGFSDKNYDGLTWIKRIMRMALPMESR